MSGVWTSAREWESSLVGTAVGPGAEDPSLMLRKRRPGLGRPGETRLSDGAPDPEALETRPSDAAHAAAADPTRAQNAAFATPATAPQYPRKFVGQRRHPARHSAKLCWT